MDGKTNPGNGESRNPFGDGKGATEKMGPSGAGNDFQKNPRGKGATTGEDVRKRPTPAQKTGPAPDLNKDGAPAESFYKASPRPQGPGSDCGTGTIGHPQKPFKFSK